MLIMGMNKFVNFLDPEFSTIVENRIIKNGVKIISTSEVQKIEIDDLNVSGR